MVLVALVLLGLTSRRYFGTANRPIFLVLLIVVLLLFSGLRHETVGIDTKVYLKSFEHFSEYNNYHSLFGEVENWADRDFYIFSWAFSKVINNKQVYLALMSAVYMLGAALICYWESPDYSFSILYMYCMGLFFFSMTGFRQTLALGIVMISYIFIVKRQLIPFILLILLASRMHKSALVFLIIYPVANFKTGWPRLLLVVTFFIIVLAFRNSIGIWIINNLPDEVVDERITGYLQSTTQYTASGFIIQLLMFVFCMRYHDEIVYDLPHREALYNLAFFGLLFQAAAMSIAEFFRVSMYFNWCYIALIPICMQYEPDIRNYEFVRLMVVVAFVTYFFYSTLNSCGIVPYHFFWQFVAES